MNIGIITWFHGPNYGTCLQAIALQKYLRNQGFHVEIINFRVIVNNGEEKKSLWHRICYQPEKYLTKYSFKKYRKDIEKKDRMLKAIIESQCILTDEIHSREDFIKICNGFDLIICGSDQIWNPNWYHKFYYVDYPEISTRKISYAPSLGINKISEDKKKKIQRSLSGFEAISVRERKGAEILEPISPVKPCVVVDPTFLLDVKDWSNIASKANMAESGEYVFCMFLTDKFAHWKAAYSFAKKKGLRLAIVPYGGFSYMQKGALYTAASVGDWLALIRDARYVITDSFHVAVFSIIYERQFYIFQRFKENEYTSQNARVDNLLEITGTKDHYIRYGSCRIAVNKDINYREIKEMLKKEIETSKQFLKQAIEGEK